MIRQADHPADEKTRQIEDLRLDRRQRARLREWLVERLARRATAILESEGKLDPPTKDHS